MVRSTDDVNSGVSIVRVVSDALVQEPAGWRSIINRGVEHVSSFGTSNVGYEALNVLKTEFEKLPGVPSRKTIQEIADTLMRSPDGTMEKLQLAKAMTPKVLAGHSLLLSLRR